MRDERDEHSATAAPNVFNDAVPQYRPIVELLSGVDALYLSGQASLPGELLGRLEVAREDAVRANEARPFLLGGVEFLIKPYGWQMYRYCLDHPFGRVGFTISSRLPAVRVQPHTEFMQGSGPRPVVQWYRDLLESECGPILFSVTRLDLFADFQGWELNGDMRRDFLCRAKSRVTYEDDENFNGFNFGKRATGTYSARIYDKTIRAEQNGEGFWKLIWGERYDPAKRVLLVEFEINREGLRQFDLSSPDDVLDAAGVLWHYLASEWLTHRVPSDDQTKARWPLSPEWQVVQRAIISENEHGLNRVYLGKRRGGVANIMPNLEGYLASMGAYAGAVSLDQLVPHLRDALAQRERDTGISFGDRVTEKHRKFGLP
jgi:hypothetical protein